MRALTIMCKNQTNVRPSRKDWRAHSKRPKQRSGKGTETEEQWVRRSGSGPHGSCFDEGWRDGRSNANRASHPNSFVIVLDSTTRSAYASRDAFDVDRSDMPNGSLKPWTLGVIPTCSDRAFPPRAVRTWVGRSARLPHRRSLSQIVCPHFSLAEGPAIAL